LETASNIQAQFLELPEARFERVSQKLRKDFARICGTIQSLTKDIYEIGTKAAFEEEEFKRMYDRKKLRFQK
jgi:hypothetical protein